MNNLSSYCGLVDAKIRASDKDLPVTIYLALPENLVSGQILKSLLFIYQVYFLMWSKLFKLTEFYKTLEYKVHKRQVSRCVFRV